MLRCEFQVSELKALKFELRQLKLDWSASSSSVSNKGHGHTSSLQQIARVET